MWTSVKLNEGSVSTFVPVAMVSSGTLRSAYSVATILLLFYTIWEIISDYINQVYSLKKTQIQTFFRRQTRWKNQSFVLISGSFNHIKASRLSDCRVTLMGDHALCTLFSMSDGGRASPPRSWGFPVVVSWSPPPRIGPSDKDSLPPSKTIKACPGFDPLCSSKYNWPSEAGIARLGCQATESVTQSNVLESQECNMLEAWLKNVTSSTSEHLHVKLRQLFLVSILVSCICYSCINQSKQYLIKLNYYIYMITGFMIILILMSCFSAKICPVI